MVKGCMSKVTMQQVRSPVAFVESILSPLLIPWVLYDPVRPAPHPDEIMACWTMPHQQHSMIQPPRAYVWAWHLPNICLHEHCIDGHCHWTIFTRLAEIWSSSRNEPKALAASGFWRRIVLIAFHILSTDLPILMYSEITSHLQDVPLGYFQHLLYQEPNFFSSFVLSWQSTCHQTSLHWPWECQPLWKLQSHKLDLHALEEHH